MQSAYRHWLLRGVILLIGTGDVFDGIVMDLNGSETFNATTVNGEVISSGNISFSNGGDVEVVGPEPSPAACFTLGPLSLLAVMGLRGHFSRRKLLRQNEIPSG